MRGWRLNVGWRAESIIGGASRLIKKCYGPAGQYVELNDFIDFLRLARREGAVWRSVSLRVAYCIMAASSWHHLRV